MKSETYKLFLAPYSESAMEKAMEMPFSRATNHYVLIYKRGNKPGPEFKQLGLPQIRLLGKRDMEWLQEVNTEIAMDFLRRHSTEEKRAAEKFLTDFQKELETEMENMKGGAENA
jgi:hypothetical protein